METLLRVKDLTLFNDWLEMYEISEGIKLGHDEAFNAYITGNLSYFLYKIIIPMVLSIHSYFAYVKLRINGLFIFIWLVLILGGMAQTLIEWNYYSVFYYINLAGYIVLTGTFLSLINLAEKNKTV